MANLSGVVQLLKKEHGSFDQGTSRNKRCARSIWQDVRKTDRGKRETLGSRTGTNSGGSTSALGESEGE
jgi:hypothetical protein